MDEATLRDAAGIAGPGEYTNTSVTLTPPNTSQNLVPLALRPLNHFLKLGQDLLLKDYIISYWCYYYAVEKGLALDKSVEGRLFIEKILRWLENENLLHKEEEAIVQNLVAEAYIEKYILDLMVKADDLERCETYNKNTVKLLYTIGFLCETLLCFQEEMSPEFMKRMKYSKWRAAYIHKCLQKGETPQSSDDSGLQEPNTALDMDIPSIPNVEEFSQVTCGQGHYVNGNTCSSDPVPHTSQQPASDGVVKEFPDSAEGSQREVGFDEIKLILEAQKYSTIAASCLDYQDIGTAK